MLFNTFKFGTRRFGVGYKAYLDPHKTINGVAVGMIIRGSISREYTFQISNGGQQRRRYYVPADPKTAGQLAQRSKFIDAVAWALGLSEAEKAVYRTKVARPWLLPGWPHSSFSNRSWFNWAISDYLVTH